VVGSGSVRAGTGPRLGLLPPDGAPVVACVPGRWPHRALRSPGGVGEPARADGRFRQRAGDHELSKQRTQILQGRPTGGGHGRGGRG